MRPWFFIIFFVMLCGTLYANCDPSRFEHNCEIPFISHPHAPLSRVYCGQRVGYITREQYELLRRYQRADVNMILTVNGQYVDSPCIPGGKRW